MTWWGEAFVFPPDQVLWLAISVGLAALIRAFTGFGFAMLVVPVFSLILAPGDAVVLSAVLALILGLVSYRSWWGVFPLAPVVPMMMGAFVGTAIGVWFLSSLSVVEFQLWIGILVVVASVALARFTPKERPASHSVAAGTGVASGLMNGAFAIPGPPVILYVMTTLTDPIQSRAFLMMFFFGSSIVSLVMFGVADLVTARPFWLLWVAIPAMWLGNELGNVAFRRFAGSAYRPFVVGLCILIGLSIATKALVAL